MHQKEKTTTIVVSAVNLVVGGTLTILRDCLAYLSTLAADGGYRIVAVVYDKNLALYPNVEYIETQWPKKRWTNRLWYEYVSLKRVSKEIGDIDLWLSLHDTTPNVLAKRQAVYCHNPFPFYRWKWRELFFTPKIVLFAWFSKYIYQKNIRRNRWVVVQQQWIREEFVRLFDLQRSSLVVALPQSPPLLDIVRTPQEKYTFIFAASPNSHKNFECLAEATKLLVERRLDGFQVYMTVQGEENAYARWLKERYGQYAALRFVGFLDRPNLFRHYGESDCLVFPSKVETWGLPVTEFAAYEQPMLLADLPYAKETAAGCAKVAFFNPEQPKELADEMERLVRGDQSQLQRVPQHTMEQPVTRSWKALFDVLLEG